MGNETQKAKGILLEWKEVRVGDDYSKTLLKLQMLTNLVQAAAEGKCSATRNAPRTGAQDNRELFIRTKPPERLIANTEISPPVRNAHV